MHIIDITKEVLSAPVYPGDPAPFLRRVQSLERGDVCNLSVLTSCVHAGTHLDAPCHFLNGGDSIDRIPLEECMGKCRVAEPSSPLVTKAALAGLPITGVRRLLLKGDAYLSAGGAQATVQAGIRLIGTGSPTIGAPGEEGPVHRILLEAGIMILEGLALESALPGDYTLAALPLKLAGSDGSPCRAVLIQEVFE